VDRAQSYLPYIVQPGLWTWILGILANLKRLKLLKKTFPFRVVKINEHCASLKADVTNHPETINRYLCPSQLRSNHKVYGHQSFFPFVPLNFNSKVCISPCSSPLSFSLSHILLLLHQPPRLQLGRLHQPALPSTPSGVCSRLGLMARTTTPVLRRRGVQVRVRFRSKNYL